MITCHIESFNDHLEELKILLPEHYKELALNQDKVPLEPQYEIYVDREKYGQLLFVTMRDAGVLVGYYIGFIAPGLHYKTCLTCITDIFYVRKDKRKIGGGKTLFEFVEQELKRRRVQRWFMGSKVHADCTFLFESIGAEKCETTHTKWLGE